MLVTIFNDEEYEFCQSLKKAIQELSGIEQLLYEPQVSCTEVGNELASKLSEISLVPSLLFIDPWGYKGLTMQLVNSVLKNWGSDCIIFFNYLRVNMALSNPIFSGHMDALFGEKRAERLRRELPSMSPKDRELTIVNELALAIQDIGGKFVLPFCFKDENGERTSHYLIFTSKHELGYSIMKEIMARESSESEQGVPSFMYVPADARYSLLFDFSRPLDDLANMLLNDFSGRTIRMRKIYEDHHVGKRYIKKNYKDILIKLESANKIVVVPPSNKRRRIKGKLTFGDDVFVTFP